MKKSAIACCLSSGEELGVAIEIMNRFDEGEHPSLLSRRSAHRQSVRS